MHIKHSFSIGNHTVTLETGEFARQATGAVVLDMDGTVVLATIVAAKDAKPEQDFFPLTVDYIEKSYAAGRIPANFFRREGGLSEREILVCRLIDRPFRPLFPDGFLNEVQIVVQVLSVNPEIDPEIPAIWATSAALAVSGIPFNGPLGAARIGYFDGCFQLNPTNSERKKSVLDLVIAGTADGIIMVESGSQELADEILLDAIAFGHRHMQLVIMAIQKLAEEGGKPQWTWKRQPKDQGLHDKLEAAARQQLEEAYRITSKRERATRLEVIRADIVREQTQGASDPAVKGAANSLLYEIESDIVRGRVLNGEPRVDGRDTRTVRPISIRSGLLPRAHGSALFTRGETQVLAVATLGAKEDEQVIDALPRPYRERFMLHYNMPPYATGETGRVGTPKRREIGHGRLAKRALTPLLPSAEEFPYSIRVVSEVTESNGSSSMASVCGGCLALMNAGVPIHRHVAGIAMGLIKEGDRFAVLTDILGDEDHLGDMDFKVAGTEEGITALQMDIKIQGVTTEIMRVALIQAREARLHVLAAMKATVEASAKELSAHAPRLLTMKIPREYIRNVVGKGGAMIRELMEQTETNINIQDDGVITISATDPAKAEEAKRRIEALTMEVEVGRVYEGVVLKLLDFGAIVSILPGRDGLLHVSEIGDQPVESVADVLSLSQVVQVRVLQTDGRGRIRLSMRSARMATAPAAV
ncbi:polyribonucleotide nucleotidyltransferase [Nitrosovibrio sp. Nv6]|uniref:polyribonucleotide nucleotidyltransferase n=1 Tax=Nitrosovibrio sp. Nv6 TaxID=1855340 RepID=UPI0008BA06A3|nr:polyribonucleotide nucleotidyltransferase [Nitrosovibrio sp. Nv6]SEP42936.1 polyribonucleotide nucleotidyltransferase [Nitrosovibrio sp. Nv6]